MSYFAIRFTSEDVLWNSYGCKIESDYASGRQAFVQITRGGEVVYRVPEVGHGITLRAVQLLLSRKYEDLNVPWDKGMRLTREKCHGVLQSLNAELFDKFCDAAEEGDLLRDSYTAYMGLGTDARNTSQANLRTVYDFVGTLLEECAILLARGAPKALGGEADGEEVNVTELLGDGFVHGSVIKPLIGEEFMPKELKVLETFMPTGYILSEGKDKCSPLVDALSVLGVAFTKLAEPDLVGAVINDEPEVQPRVAQASTSRVSAVPRVSPAPMPTTHKHNHYIVMLTKSEFTFALSRSLARLANGFLFSFLAVEFLALEMQDLHYIV
jgi:hypothetical protein